jgi:RNase adapter protein RapZ
MELIVVTGLSGAGRRSVLSVLEDMGCTALDNVPVKLLDSLLELETKVHPDRPRLAVGMDSRQDDFIGSFVPALEALQGKGIFTTVLFLEASDEVLLRRFSETRRPHHLAPQASPADGIAKERHLLSPIRDRANAILDTSKLNLTELRQRILELLPSVPSTQTTVRVLSFGFKHGIPSEADVVWDARFLPNPYYVPELRPLTGREGPVQDFLMASREFQGFLDRAEDWLRWSLPLIKQEGRAYHTIAIGCTGGQHRSVALVELLAKRLRTDLPGLVVQHRELKAAIKDGGSPWDSGPSL